MRWRDPEPYTSTIARGFSFESRAFGSRILTDAETEMETAKSWGWRGNRVGGCGGCGGGPGAVQPGLCRYLRGYFVRYILESPCYL
jgi:hypothetical protein